MRPTTAKEQEPFLRTIKHLECVANDQQRRIAELEAFVSDCAAIETDIASNKAFSALRDIRDEAKRILQKSST